MVLAWHPLPIGRLGGLARGVKGLEVKARQLGKVIPLSTPYRSASKEVAKALGPRPSLAKVRIRRQATRGTGQEAAMAGLAKALARAMGKGIRVSEQAKLAKVMGLALRQARVAARTRARAQAKAVMARQARAKWKAMEVSMQKNWHHV